MVGAPTGGRPVQASTRLERELFDAGQCVMRCPMKLMTRTRASARNPRKVRSDRCVVRGPGNARVPDLPVASHDAASRGVPNFLMDQSTLLRSGRRRSTACCGLSMSSTRAIPRTVFLLASFGIHAVHDRDCGGVLWQLAKPVSMM